MAEIPGLVALHPIQPTIAEEFGLAGPLGSANLVRSGLLSSRGAVLPLAVTRDILSSGLGPHPAQARPPESRPENKKPTRKDRLHEKQPKANPFARVMPAVGTSGEKHLGNYETPYGNLKVTVGASAMLSKNFSGESTVHVGFDPRKKSGAISIESGNFSLQDSVTYKTLKPKIPKNVLTERNLEAHANATGKIYQASLPLAAPQKVKVKVGKETLSASVTHAGFSVFGGIGSDGKPALTTSLSVTLAVGSALIVYEVSASVELTPKTKPPGDRSPITQKELVHAAEVALLILGLGLTVKAGRGNGGESEIDKLLNPHDVPG